MNGLDELRGTVETRNVDRIRLIDFRNYVHLDIEFGTGFHLLAGPNAQGKTNLLEALYLLSTARLLRGMRDAEAIREGADRALVEADVAGGSTTIAIHLDRGVRKRALLNGLGLPKASDVLGRLMSVCISSADLPIVSGEPSDRRLFLDIELSQLYPGYLKALAGYKRAMEQRNALLKAAQDRFVPDEAYEPWEVQMADNGALLRKYRSEFLIRVSPHAEAAHARLGAGEALELRYVPKDEAVDADQLYAQWGRNRASEIARGSSSYGPHRDDVLFLVEGREARLFGSQGQQRSAVIALKLATHEHFREVTSATPLLLLDDMLSDLDEDRRARLCDWVIEHAGQAVLTCTEARAAGARILESATIFDVHAGNVGLR